MNTTRSLLSASVAIATALALSACSNGSGTGGMNGMDHGDEASSSRSESSAADVNHQDEMFVVMMKPHHEQAIEMADIILAKEGISAQVTDLATQIKDAQAPEIDQFEEWMTAWEIDDSVGGMDDGMDGMMSDDDLDELTAATGADAEKLFLEQMIDHHEGAIEMAENEIDDGSNADVVELAKTIVTTQTAEIETMRDLLAAY